MIFFLFIIFMVSSNLGIFYADIKWCSKNEDDLQVKAGQPFNLCCWLSEDMCRQTTKNDTIILTPKEYVTEIYRISSRLTRERKCRVRYSVSNATMKDQGEYLCYKNFYNNTVPPLMRAHLYVLEAPLEPQIEDIVYFEKSSTVMVRYLKNIGSDWIDEYTVTISGNSKNKAHYNESSCIKLKPEVDECYIKVERKILHFPVNITVKATRPSKEKISSCSSKVVNLFRHVLPSPVLNLSYLKSADPSQVNITFQLSEETNDNFMFMNSLEKPLSYHITLTGNGNSKFKLMLIIQPSDLYIYQIRYHNIAIVFNDLTPHTNYTALVSGAAGGGMNSPEIVNFMTASSEPLAPPVLHDFSFSRACYNNQSDAFSCLYVSWEPMPPSARGADNIKYLVEIQNLETNYFKKIETAKSYINKVSESSSYSVKVWAKNDLGMSKNFSQLYIPTVSGKDDTKIHVNFKDDQAIVYLRLSSRHNDLEALAIHWCNSDIEALCQEGSMHTQLFTISQKSKFTSWTVSLKPQYKNITRKFSELVQFYGYNQNKINFSAFITKDANVSQNVYKKNKLQDKNVNSPTDLLCTEGMKDCIRTETLINNSLENNSPKMVFVSFKDGGQWQGMLPADCYYYEDADIAEFQVSKSTVGERTDLIIEQKCKSELSPPRQFLVTQFEIYSSSDKICTKNKASELKLKELPNNMFDTARWELPHNLSNSYICVLARGHSRTTAKNSESIWVDYQEGTVLQDYLWIIIIVCAFMLVIIITLALIFPIKRCKKRKEFYRNLKSVVKSDSEKSISVTLSKDQSQVTAVKMMDNSCSDDSGHGTESNDTSSANNSTSPTYSIEERHPLLADSHVESLAWRSGEQHCNSSSQPLNRHLLRERSSCHLLPAAPHTKDSITSAPDAITDACRGGTTVHPCNPQLCSSADHESCSHTFMACSTSAESSSASNSTDLSSSTAMQSSSGSTGNLNVYGTVNGTVSQFHFQHSGGESSSSGQSS